MDLFDTLQEKEGDTRSLLPEEILRLNFSLPSPSNGIEKRTQITVAILLLPCRAFSTSAQVGGVTICGSSILAEE